MKETFIDKVLEGAEEGYRSYGILPSLVIAQAILESGWGRSDLVTKTNNLFGIKADKKWNGEKVLAPTKEFINGEWIDINAYFRKYKTLDDSILDHAKFLNKDIYLKVRQAKNYKKACKEVYKAKYATDPNYTNELIRIIEQNELYKYDGAGEMRKLIVVIDVGHGGRDPGAVGNGLKEKDRALTYALKLGKALEKQGVTVIYTRNTDVFIELRDRSRISNEAGAILFISIHLNSFSDPKANGVETLYYPTSSKGKEFASNIQSEIVKAGLCNSDRGIKPRDNLSVLGPRTKAPAVLVELGFISNASDVQLLANKEDEIVKAITRGILKSLDVKYREEDLKPSKEEVKGGNIVKVNFKGKDIEVDGKMIDNTNYVSIREVFEKLGHKVSWDKENKIVIID